MKRNIKRKYFVVVEKAKGFWIWIVWSHDRALARGDAPTKTIALEISRVVRDKYERLVK